MLGFCPFQARAEPFGRTFPVLFKRVPTAISIRHADTVDVKFILMDQDGGRTEKTIALPHADVQHISKETGRSMDDPWCARLAELHLLHLVATGEDMEKDVVTVTYADLKRYAGEIAHSEQSEVRAG